jgi:prepilin-type N-terminal cleavage/methylation domain-containing protein
MAGVGIGSRRGFTLVEIVIVIVVAGLLMGIAAPRFTRMRNSLRLDTAARTLAADLRRAQTEAIKRNKTIVVAKVNDSTYSMTDVGNRLLASGGPQFTAAAMTVSFASFGPPVGGGATFTINYAGSTKTVTVNASGLVTVQ